VYRSLRLISAHRPMFLRFPISRYPMIIREIPILFSRACNSSRYTVLDAGHLFSATLPLATGSNAILTPPVLLESRTSGADGVND
jgi:hypothetical protein